MASTSGAKICGIVLFREPNGKCSVPAIITATLASFSYQLGNNPPSLTDADHVHLTVLTPMVLGPGVPSTPFGGVYQAFDVPFWPPIKNWALSSQAPGTWTWPPS